MEANEFIWLRDDVRMKNESLEQVVGAFQLGKASYIYGLDHWGVSGASHITIQVTYFFRVFQSRNG